MKERLEKMRDNLEKMKQKISIFEKQNEDNEAKLADFNIFDLLKGGKGGKIISNYKRKFK